MNLKLLKLTLLSLSLFHYSATSWSSEFAYGADIGWVSQLESEGVTWVDVNGNQQDPIALLKEKGVNSVRLRVFVNPPENFYWYKDNTTWTMLGFTDKQSVISAAVRASSLGMRVMVDFHYSDVFADPAHQITPDAWSSFDEDQLIQAIYDHTSDVMLALKEHGVIPEWVQVGNEINPGILLPTGSTNNFSALTRFLNSGYAAVKAVSPTSKVITHLAHGANNSDSRFFFDNFLTTYQGKTDVIGFSIYPYWESSTIDQLKPSLISNLNDMAERYGKEVMIVEVGGLEGNPNDSYHTLYQAIDAVNSVSDEKGIGVFYWEPAAHSSVLPDNYELGATAIYGEKTLQFTTALDAFNNYVNEGSSTEQYQVTFKVDMTGISGTAYITGSFSGSGDWQTLPMTHEGNNIWYYTTILQGGDTGAFYFLNSQSWSDRETVPSACALQYGTDRQYNITGHQIVSAIWGSCAPVETGDENPTGNEVLFKVDMTNTPGAAFITGSFTGVDSWSILPMEHEGNNIWSFRTQIEQGSVGAFYFLNANSWSSRESVPQECALQWNVDRQFEVTGSNNRYAYSWNSCDNF